MSATELFFELPGGGHVLFTARAHGNLSSIGGDGSERGSQAREALREQLGVRRLFRGYQVHGTAVRQVEDETEGGDDVEADGQVTALRDVGAMVLTADCLPVALGCSGAVAMVHAGWRGLAAGILEEGVRAVRELGDESEIVAVVGPGAGPCCYEVGEELQAAFGGAYRDGRNIDLKAIARERLLAAGVADVQDVAACTICDERFFSYRREGARAGRQGGVAWLS
ncbi:MAG TPA: polyphenol oxidase family protein [Solirubrobacteraceae bacterium]